MLAESIWCIWVPEPKDIDTLKLGRQIGDPCNGCVLCRRQQNQCKTYTEFLDEMCLGLSDDKTWSPVVSRVFLILRKVQILGKKYVWTKVRQQWEIEVRNSLFQLWNTHFQVLP